MLKSDFSDWAHVTVLCVLFSFNSFIIYFFGPDG